MPKVTAVRLRLAGNNGYYDPEEYNIHIGDKVIVETDRGEEVGEVTIPVIEVSDEKLKEPLKKIERLCTKEDLSLRVIFLSKLGFIGTIRPFEVAISAL